MNKIKDKLILFFFLFFSLSFIVSGVVESQDGLQYLAVARNIYYQHEPTAPVYEYGKENGWKNVHMSTYVGKNGKTYSLTGLGFSLAMLPSVATTDIIYKIYDITPPVHFPLENDWLIFFNTSFVNVFYASWLGLIIFLYLIECKIKKNNALVITLLAIFTTNLLAFSKHITAHMMFTSMLFTSFFLIKKHQTTNRRKYLFFSGIFYGITIITYNNTFILSIPSLFIYYLTLNYFQFNRKKAVQTFFNLLSFFIGVLPFIVIYNWFEHLRVPGLHPYSSIAFIAGWAKTRIITVPTTLFFEGLWGQLFSPGRSIFLYSPILLSIAIFWFKLKKNIFPEIILFISFFSIYICFYATQFMTGSPEQGYVGLWPGESSWGPRYLSPIIPFGILLVGWIYQNTSKTQKLLIFIPLSLLGLYIEILGITMPYQIKYYSLDKSFYVNNTEYNVYTYSNLLPRYSPIIIQTKNFFNLTNSIKQTSIPGKYNFTMYDGINPSFNVGHERWRSIDQTGYISFDQRDSKIENISFDFINHPMSKTKSTLQLNFDLNGQDITPNDNTLLITERKKITLNLKDIKLKDTNNQLIINADFDQDNIIEDNEQIAGLLNIWVDEYPVNKELIRVPYISSLGPKLSKTDYQNWGGINNNQWKFWDIHTQVYEKTPDFWWIKPLYYWDIPNKPFIILLLLDIYGIIIFSMKLLTNIIYKKTTK